MFENPFFIYSHQNIHSCKKEIIILIFLFFSLIFDMNTFLYIFLIFLFLNLLIKACLFLRLKNALKTFLKFLIVLFTSN